MSDDVARKIVGVFCQFNCQMTIGQLTDQLTKRCRIEVKTYSRLLEFLEKYPELFHIVHKRMTVDSDVYLRVRIPWCSDHCNKNGQCPNGDECQGLHICKFYLLSSCQFKKCNYGHNLTHGPNLRVLQRFLLDQLPIADIKVVIRDVRNRSALTKPETCRFYNLAKGCSKPKCPFLHICQHYTTGACKFGQKCSRNHNIDEKSVLDILGKYGVNIQQPVNEILLDLKEMMKSNDAPIDGICRPDTQPLSPPPMPHAAFGAMLLNQEPSYPTAMDFKGARPKVPTQTAAQGQNVKQISSSGQGRAGKAMSETCAKEICLYKLSGKCRYGDQCIRQHKNMIYQWQHSEDKGNTWKDFDGDLNEEIEKNFHQPEKPHCLIRLTDQVVKIIFSEPMIGSDRTGVVIMDVQRLSTGSSAASDARPQFAQWATEWRWYWQSPSKDWVLFGDEDSYGNKPNILSEELESKYQENTCGWMDFETEQFQYRLDFSDMTQENMITERKREVRRRPQFFKKEDLKNRRLSDTTGHEVAPKEWSEQNFSTQKPLHKHYKEIEVKEDTDEYKKVKEMFSKTLSPDRIRSILRIENGNLWERYTINRTRMSKSDKPVKVRQLFHGTGKDTVEAISHQGFDFRFSGSRVGARLGRGSYFARDAKYSQDYCEPDMHGRAQMFVARVLVGDYTPGQSGYVRPPSKSPANPHELFDSCVDNVKDPSIFVIFSLEQIYPEYLITFKRG